MEDTRRSAPETVPPAAATSPWPELCLPLGIAAALNLWNLGQNGYGYIYYSVAMPSMLQSPRNLFFAAYDAGGFISIDKPPVSLWLQALSVSIFGFNGLPLLLLQALAGVLMVAVLYFLVRRAFGTLAGFAAALALALTPIAVDGNRENGVDTWLTLLLLLAATALILAVEQGRLGLLLTSMALVGVAFNIKMLAAWIVLPAFYLLYLLGAPLTLRKRIGHLALGSVVLLVVSFAWVAAVDLTPKADRPWVGGINNNSELELALGYNGIARITADDGGANEGFRDASQGIGRGRAPNRGGASESLFNTSALFGGGYPGPLRLVEGKLVGQWSWLLALALAALFAAPILRRRWSLLYGVVFSSAQGLFHPYYLNVIAPAAAALAGIGVAGLREAFAGKGVGAALLPLTLLATALWQMYILLPFPSWGAWLVPILLAGAVIAAGGLLLLRFWWHDLRWVGALVGVGLAALLVAPLAWAMPPLMRAPVNASLPLAGPDAINQNDPSAWTSLDNHGNDGLIAYLESHSASYYLLAVSNAQQASALTLQSGRPVLAAAGFMGTDPALSGERLAALVAAGQVRFVYGMTGMLDGGPTAGGWILANCANVPARVRRAGQPQPWPERRGGAAL